jgi:leader peptidase (prepilin peptidase)/N-methyltransferase
MTQDALTFFFTNLFTSQRWLWAVMGACVGSFLSVVAYRLPRILEAKERGERPPFTLSLPASACPVCNKPLKFWANLPVVGYLLSKGKCSHCGVHIPARYLLLELVAAGWALAATYLWAEPLAVGAWSVFGWYLLVMGWMDAQTKWLPNVLTLSLLALGLVFSTSASALLPLTGALLAAAVTYGVVIAMNLAFSALRNKVGLGGGDAKLLAALAAWLGGLSALYVFTGACFLFVTYYFFTHKKGDPPEIAFGPALCVVAAGAALYLAR